jgi:hypothetical protein
LCVAIQVSSGLFVLTEEVFTTRLGQRTCICEQFYVFLRLIARSNRVGQETEIVSLVEPSPVAFNEVGNNRQKLRFSAVILRLCEESQRQRSFTSFRMTVTAKSAILPDAGYTFQTWATPQGSFDELLPPADGPTDIRLSFCNPLP